jgi:hypothetical protein
MKKELLEEEPRLLQLKDGLGRLGHTTDQKLLVCFRCFANGVSFSQLDDLVRISVESQGQVFAMFLNSVKIDLVLAILTGSKVVFIFSGMRDMNGPTICSYS